MFLKKIFLLFFLVNFIFNWFYSQNALDTIHCMNGQKIGATIIDTSFALITYKIPNSKHPEKIRNIEKDDVFCIQYKNATPFYYYSQDTARGDWFTREEMWHFTQGERDAQKGFKPIPNIIIGGTIGFLSGATGMYIAPVLPLGFYLVSDITKIKIRHSSISNPELLQYDAYILGYQRVAKTKRRVSSIISGATGLLFRIYDIFCI